MADNKFATINPVDPDDRKALFDLICREMAFMKPMDVKKNILVISGSTSELQSYIPDLVDIMRLLEIYEVESSLKITYSALKTDGEKKWLDHQHKVEEAQVGPLTKEKLCDEHKKLKAQADEIINPEFKLYRGDIIGTKEVQENTIDMNQMPDLPDFLQ